MSTLTSNPNSLTAIRQRGNITQMLAKVTTCAVVGLEGAIVEVEVDISPGLPSFTNVAR